MLESTIVCNSKEHHYAECKEGFCGEDLWISVGGVYCAINEVCGVKKGRGSESGDGTE
ncbi:Hypothetical predicted protein [Olea europaea subsp. europaea]|uniref:Uncharacterized protein n=1 Tax=Olea europaea subsp. europaea TaxID=158383 RepID=A0A8S0PYX0_OLEEU|nr:Hypothetical predicted protein [Olea europaea subsp. europaea]